MTATQMIATRDRVTAPSPREEQKLVGEKAIAKIEADLKKVALREAELLLQQTTVGERVREGPAPAPASRAATREAVKSRRNGLAPSRGESSSSASSQPIASTGHSAERPGRQLPRLRRAGCRMTKLYPASSCRTKFAGAGLATELAVDTRLVHEVPAWGVFPAPSGSSRP